MQVKISYRRLQQYIGINHSPTSLAGILESCGLKVERVEKKQAIHGGLEGLIVGEVKTCHQHPNAERLKITIVDIGQAHSLQIICGAPNVIQGQKVVVAPAGTKIYPTQGEPFKIKKTKLRGETSEGMICAEDEIGLGNSHAEIIVLDKQAQVGVAAKEYIEIEEDTIFEINPNPNWASAVFHLGVALDLAEHLKVDLQIHGVSNKLDKNSIVNANNE